MGLNFRGPVWIVVPENFKFWSRRTPPLVTLPPPPGNSPKVLMHNQTKKQDFLLCPLGLLRTEKNHNRELYEERKSGDWTLHEEMRCVSEIKKQKEKYYLTKKLVFKLVQNFTTAWPVTRDLTLTEWTGIKEVKRTCYVTYGELSRMLSALGSSLTELLLVVSTELWTQ